MLSQLSHLTYALHVGAYGHTALKGLISLCFVWLRASDPFFNMTLNFIRPEFTLDVFQIDPLLVFVNKKSFCSR